MTATALDSFQRWRPLLDGLAREIHPLRWAAAGVGAEAAARLAANPRSERLLSLRLGWLGGTSSPGRGVDGGWPDWTAWENADAATLHSGAELERCGFRLGAALFRREAAKLVFGRDVAAFKAEVGADAYFFALRQATLARAFAGLSPDRAKGKGLIASARRAAWLGLAAWLGFQPEGLSYRTALKLPPAVDEAGRETASWPEKEREAWSGAMAAVFSVTNERT